MKPSIPIHYPEETRSKALTIVREQLQLEEPTRDALIAMAREHLGQVRTQQYLRSIDRDAALQQTQSHRTLASLAVLVVTTRQLGARWWQGRAEDLLSQGQLDALEWLGEDASADALWGPPVAVVDLNSMVPDDRFPLPSGAKVGQRLVLSFDPGSRIDAVVVDRGEGRLGSQFIEGTIRHAPAAEASWGWAVYFS